MADKTANDVAPTGAAGHAPLHGPHTVAADGIRPAATIIDRPGMSRTGPARSAVPSAVPGRYRQGAGRPKLVGARPKPFSA